MYISISDAAVKFNISKRRVQSLCEQGRIRGANMVSGVWLIPETAEKPTDRRKRDGDNKPTNSLEHLQQTLTINDVCRLLSISNTTAKNWIRLGKIVPDAGDQLFTHNYVDKLVSELKSSDSTKLKSRRNKTSISGKVLYKDYIQTEVNQRMVAELLDLGIIETQNELRIVLANYAVQLYFQSHGIAYSDCDVLEGFLVDEQNCDFYILIKDLLGDVSMDPISHDKLHPALSKELFYERGEDSLGFVYISLRDIGQRRSSGMYYTPERVVNQLIDSIIENDEQLNNKTILDPCCGTGNFLLRLSAKGILYTNLFGQDIDPISVYLSRINMALSAPFMSAADICSRITIGDTLFQTSHRKFDVILGNPPWGSILPEENIARYHRLFKTAAGRSFDSYDLFIEKALNMLDINGVLAFVLPEAVLNVASHSIVRRLILDSCSIKFAIYLGNVFSGVQCPSVILGLALDNRRTAIGCKVTTSNNRFVISQSRVFKDGMLPLDVSDSENDCLNAIGSIRNVAYLRDNAKFALGIVTGNNKKYISEKKNEENEIVLKGCDIQKYSITASEKYIRFVPESFQQVAPTDLYRAKEKLMYRFVCEVPVFAYDDQQRLSLNSCNIVIPDIPGLKMKYILAVLNSSVAAFYITKRFRSVKLLRSHIELMPIPVVPTEVQTFIIDKVDRIMDASEGVIGLYTELDRKIMELFGLNAGQVATIHSSLSRKHLFLKAN